MAYGKLGLFIKLLLNITLKWDYSFEDLPEYAGNSNGGHICFVTLEQEKCFLISIDPTPRLCESKMNPIKRMVESICLFTLIVSNRMGDHAYTIHLPLSNSHISISMVLTENIHHSYSVCIGYALMLHFKNAATIILGIIILLLYLFTVVLVSLS